MRKKSLDRRRFLAASAATVLFPHSFPAFSAATCAPNDGFRRPKHRLALILANGAYPRDDSLLPAKKNANDLSKLLREGFGFEVTVGQDLGLAEMRQLIAKFTEQTKALIESGNVADGDLATLVYFCGHGLQRKGMNYLVPANIDQNQDKVEEKCLSLQTDVLAKLPQRTSSYPGLNVVLVDACRTGGNRMDSFAQFASVQGCTVTISSSSGSVAFFPEKADENSYFTQALLEVFEEEHRNPLRKTSIEELLVLVEKQTETISKVKFIDEENRERKAKGQEPYPPQRPESTKNLRNPPFLLQTSATACLALERQRSADQLAAFAKEEVRFLQIAAEIYPSKIRPLCTAFLNEFPNSDFRSRVQARLYGAEKTAQAIKLVRIATDTLVTPDPAGDAIYKDDLVKASTRGDKDASQRVAWMYRDGLNGLAKNQLRYLDFLRLSAELGNGIASFELYEVLRRLGNPDARYFLRRAKELGFPVPKDLPEER